MANKKYGLIDRTGKVVKEPQFDLIMSFENDGFRAIIFENPEKGIEASAVDLDRQGNTLETGVKRGIKGLKGR
jgi:hypothetical protein